MVVDKKFYENKILEIYGVENISQNEYIRDKIKMTNIERYGVEYSSQNKNIRNKIKKTNIEKYGVECVLQNEEIKKKIKSTNLEKYGVECVLQNEEIKKKIKSTNLKLFGVENVSQNYSIHKKQHNGYIRRHYNGLYYRGTYEKDFIDFCLENEIEIENFKGTLDYEFIGINRKYFPDFYISCLNLVVEIKSKYTYEIEKEQNLAKKEASINKGFNFIFVIDKNYDEINKRFRFH